MGSNASVFLEALPEQRRESFQRSPGLEDWLFGLVGNGKREWPHLVLDETELVRFIAARAPEVRESLPALCAGDLYLACAAARGDAVAGAAVRERCYPKLRAALVSAGLGDAVDDTAQQVFTELLVPDASGSRGILSYRGTGELAAFVKVIALRTARRALKQRSRERPVDPATLLEDAGDAVDPELQALKQKYRVEFKAAFHVALSSLSDRERNILRYELVGGLNIDQIGALYDVHRATVARWRAAAREKLFENTQQALRTKLAIGSSDFHSVVRLIQSQLDVSLHRVLSDDADEGR